jgi:hypothetical protein
MAVEALASLGHDALISGLVDVYVPRLPSLADGRPLDEEQRKAAVGQFDRVTDWLASYELALRESPWSEVLARAFAPEGEDLAARPLALHALVRLGYAVRSLSRYDIPVRRRELAFGLAYVAARSSPSGDGTAAGDSAQEWAARVRGTEESGEALGELISTLCLRGAESYLADLEQRTSRSHAVVASSAVRFLIPHLPSSVLKQLLVNLVLQLGEVLPLQGRSRVAEESADAEVSRCAESASEIRYRAACSVHEHAIVMAEACLREETVRTHKTLLRAAADAALRLSPPGYQEWR